VEQLAWRTLILLRRELGAPLRLPVDVDLIGELVCGLRWDWDVIPEPPGRRIWAGLFPRERRVVMNERHLALYRQNEGLERFTKAHEVGHWICHVQGGTAVLRAGRAVDPRCCRLREDSGSFHAERPATALTQHLARSTGGRPLDQHDWQERHANWFAAALLMPAPLVLSAAGDLDLDRWRDRYALRDRFNVSISALNTRLASLGLAKYVKNGFTTEGFRLAPRPPSLSPPTRGEPIPPSPVGRGAGG